MYKKMLALSVLALAALDGAAHAGQKITAPVSINDSAGLATGSLGSARNSADTVQRIACNTTAIAGKSFGLCTATNSLGKSHQCYSEDPHLVAAMRSIHAGSFVAFYWDKADNCTQIVVESGSELEPPLP